MIQKVVKNYRADIVTSVNGSTQYRSQKDKFYVKDACLQKVWDQFKEKEWTLQDLFETACKLVSPTVENMEYIVVDMETGI